jgi:hypothetical protein
MPSHRLDIQQIPLTLRPTLHPKIIPTRQDQQIEAGRLFSGLLVLDAAGALLAFNEACGQHAPSPERAGPADRRPTAPEPGMTPA